MGGANFVTIGAVPDPINDGVQVSSVSVAATPATVISAVAGKRIMVHGMHLTAAASTTLTVQDGTVALTGPMLLAAGQPLVLPWQNYPYYTCAAGDALVFAQATAATIGGRIMYVQG